MKLIRFSWTILAWIDIFGVESIYFKKGFTKVKIVEGISPITFQLLLVQKS